MYESGQQIGMMPTTMLVHLPGTLLGLIPERNGYAVVVRGTILQMVHEAQAALELALTTQITSRVFVVPRPSELES